MSKKPQKKKPIQFNRGIKLMIIFFILCVFMVWSYKYLYYLTTNYPNNIVSKTVVTKEPIVKKVIPKPSCSIILDDKMQQLSNYIKIRKSDQPEEICNMVAYHVVNISKQNNIPVDIIVGIIEVESVWNIYAKSKVGAKGLMQVYKEDGIDIDPKKVYGIKYNINTGVQILKSKLRKSKGDISLALNYYVGGDKKYQDKVYNALGRYMLYKMNNVQLEINKLIKPSLKNIH